jgi:DUF971 family protein
MAGLTKDSPLPTEIKLHQQTRRFEVAFDDGQRFEFTFEFLRVQSPSAEVRGHGPGQETLQVGKRDVAIDHVEPVGNYGIQPTFSDGHATGIYSWDYLYDLGQNQEALWADYLKRLAAGAGSRDVAGAQPAVAKPTQPVAKPTEPAAKPAVAAAKPELAPAKPPGAGLGTTYKL